MPGVIGPVHVRATIPNALTTFQAKVNIPNITNLKGIRVYNKGPFDIKFSGPIQGEDWILAGTSKSYKTGINFNNSGLLLFTAFSTNANSDSQFYDTAMYNIVLVTYYQQGEYMEEGTNSIQYVQNTPDLSILNAPACQGTTVTVPFSNSNNAPFSNNKFCFLLGFTMTGSNAAANASADMIIQNISGNNQNSSQLNYIIHSDVQIPFYLKETYPRNGIANTTGQQIQFVVPAVSTMALDLCVFYTFNPEIYY